MIFFTWGLAIPTVQGQCDQDEVVVAASRSMATDPAALSDDSPSRMQVGSLLLSPTVPATGGDEE